MNRLNAYVVLLLTIVFSHYTYAQKPVIEFHKTTHDFGKIESAGYEPIVFEFTNTGDAPLAILKYDADRSVQVSYKNEYIRPGEKGSISVYYFPEDVGKFNKKILVYTNTDEYVHTLTIKGTSLVTNPCPGQNQYDATGSPYSREIIVLNRKTREPVISASVNMLYNERTELSGKTGTNGSFRKVLKPGLYEFKVKEEGYETYKDIFYLKKTYPVIVIELDPLDDYAGTEEEAGDDHQDVQKEEIVNIAEKEDTEIIDDNDPGTTLSVGKYSSNNIVFLVDVSSSMKLHNKLELLQRSIKSLINVLRDIDNVSVISYAGKPIVLLTTGNGGDKERIINVIDSLEAYGKTYGVKGLDKAYEIAYSRFEKDGNNQIILATDGEFNSPGFSEKELMKTVSENAGKGVILSVVGFGDSEESLERMKRVAQTGKGNYIHITTEENSANVLIEEIKSNSLINDH